MGVLDVEYKKRQGYGLDPAVIRLPNHDLQGRFAPKPKKVLEMAISLLVEGQKQNIIIRKDHENHPILVAGFRRRAAGLMINEQRHDPEFLEAIGDEARAKLELLGDDPFLLDAKLDNINEAQAFLANVRENVEREQLSPMDCMKIVLILRHQGMNDAAIAKIFGRKPWYVYHLMKLATLSPRIQELVDQGIIKLEVAAKTLARVPESEREMMVDGILEEQRRAEEEDEATEPDSGDVDAAAMKRITGATLARHERQRREQKGTPGKAIRRTLSETRKFCRTFIDGNESDPVTPLFTDILAFIEGSIGERALVKRCREHLSATASSAPAKKAAKS